MKPSYILAAAAALASSGCNAERGNDAAVSEATATEAVKPPASGDWTEVVTGTSAGGFRMGNPDAKVKLVEFGSMTCPHCAAFDKNAVEPLTSKYVKTGQVSYEFRNYVRDPFDISASLIARCNGSKSFFALTHALFNDQQAWIAKVQQAPPAQLEAVQNMGPDSQFLAIAKLADLQKWASMRGVPTAKSTQCLTDQASINKLVEMNSDATSAYPNFAGTPTFVINGKMVELGQVTEAQVWPTLEAKIRAALGS
ncbi:MAG TPA: thioredoxin domain-containing protein [Sphingomicrobium sp.]|nr:thioredoxin domain-containing protein [Sphingomicrobium sp.]